jgi:predicted adenine nucleotide alpha hydrolase (AANH) superfamily ATPase
MIKIAKRKEFYRQEYRGCAYSPRDTNAHRRATGREAIQIGTQFYRLDSSD